MTEMIICGLSMEMEMAKEYDGVGKCSWCLYYDKLNNGALFCRKNDELLDEEKDDCKDWIVNHR